MSNENAQNEEIERDDHVVQACVSKKEERHMMNHPDFETVVSKYWHIIKHHSSGRANADEKTITRAQYSELLSRMYRVLAPLYREDEMKALIEQEWVFDSHGADTMDQNLFTKFIFRIAHQWAASINLAEYCELLEKIFQRVTHKQIVRSGGKIETAYPTIQVCIDQEKQPQSEDFEDVDWMSCATDESEFDDYDYQVREDGRKMKMRKTTQEGVLKDVFLTARDPFYFKESVIYYQSDERGETQCMPPSEEDFEYEVLTEHTNIFPLGYPTEQYLAWVKNDVHKAMQELKAQQKKSIQNMRKELHTGGGVQNDKSQLNFDRERGLIEESGRFVTQFFSVYRTHGAVLIQTRANMHDATYNSLRSLLKDNSQLQIRPSFENPSRLGYKEELNLQQTLTRFSVQGYNPCLERRLNYVWSVCRLHGDKECQQFVNVNYLICDPIFETAFRSDVNRIETSSKMVIKPNEEFTRDEEFCNVTTTFQDACQIMLQKKYESFFTIKLQGDSDIATERDRQIFDAEQLRKKNARINEKLNAKQLTENFECKDFLKDIRGPFYKLQSKSGPTEDDFATCAQHDLIASANKETIRCLLIGRPRCGKTTLAKQLEQRLNLVRVAADAWIDNLMKKIKDREENPPEEPEQPEPELIDPENPDLGYKPVPPPPSWLQPLEEKVINTLKDGGAPSDAEICQMIKQMVESNEARTRGYVLDLDFFAYEEREEPKSSWVQRFRKLDILGAQNLTHIVDLQEDSSEVRQHASQLFATVDGQVHSKWQRDARINRKKPVDEDGEPIEEDEEVVAMWRPLNRFELVQRVCDNETNIDAAIKQYEASERPDADDLITHLFASTYVKMPIAGLVPDEIADAVQYRLKPNTSEPPCPVAKQIEGAGDFGGLLTTDVNIDEGQLPRQFSLWKMTDPVALLNGKVVQGVPDFACHYANNVFVFETEENMKEFISNPRRYLKSAPHMPPDFRVLLLGPRGAGVKTQARKLHEKYGWRLVDFNQIVRAKLAEILALPIKKPNNILKEEDRFNEKKKDKCEINLSNEELQEIKDGKPFAAWKFLPWIMEYLNVPLMIKPPEKKVVDEEPPQLTDKEKKKIEEEKKKKAREEAEAKAAKEERQRKRQEALDAGLDLAELGLEESDEEDKYDDLSITQFTTLKDEEGNPPKIGKIILYGFPQTELHIAKMKEFGLVFDRIIYLNDMSDENPGQQIKQRMAGSDIAFDWDEENAKAQKILAIVKEFIGEEQIVEVDCTGTQADVAIKLRTKIDPFFTQVDSEECRFDWSSLPNEDEENPRRGPKGDFGDYCPVTYINSGFLVKGKQDFEQFIFGKSYRFAGEKEQEEFKFNPDAFLSKVSIPLPPPEPKIMLVGMKGSGVSTQIQNLCKKYKIASLELQNKFLALMDAEKAKRQRSRRLTRGFKEPEPDEERKLGDPLPADPEIDEDPAEFADNIQQHYVELFQSIIESKKAQVMDGNWTTLPEGIEVDLGETLVEARRTPEIVIILKCSKETTFQRCIDDEQLRREEQADQKAREEEIAAKMEEDRLEKLRELQEENKQDPELPEEERKSQQEIDAVINAALQDWIAERIEADKQALEDDPVKNFQTRREEAEEALAEQLAKDEAFLEGFVEKMQEAGVEIHEMNSDSSAQYVHIKLVEKLKQRMAFRHDLIEREQAIDVLAKDVKFYEESYTYKHSKFGLSSPLSQFNPSKTKTNTVLYRERLYFLADESEKARFLQQPSQYTINCEPVPQDLIHRPTACVIGLPASGKTVASQIIAERTGMVHLRPQDIIDFFVKRESVFSERLRQRIMNLGEEVDDSNFIEMLSQRIQQRDCLERGWVLNGYPQTRHQAVQMAQRGIVPDNVFHITVPIAEVYNRTVGRIQSDFNCDRSILVRRLQRQARSVPDTGFFYNKFYNNLVTISGLKSHYYMTDLALDAIQKTLKARLEFARDFYFQDRPCVMEGLGYDRILMKKSISQYGYMCPVSWKVHKKFVNCTHRPEFTVLYQNFFYYFAGAEERAIFIQDPVRFTTKLHFSHERNIPKRLRFHKAAEIIAQEKQLLGHCPVTLKDENRVVKGYQLSVVSFKDNRFVFASEEKAAKFFLCPSAYASVQLPVKMPPNKDPVLLSHLKKENSETFMAQALGSVVTRALREVGENRLKYPTLSVKETMLKLFAILLKAENPANTEYMRKKYYEKMHKFIQRCEVAQELYELAQEKASKDKPWPQFKEDHYNKLGADLDKILKEVPKEIQNGFCSYMK